MVRTEIPLFLKNIPGEPGKLSSLLEKNVINLLCGLVLRGENDRFFLFIFLTAKLRFPGRSGRRLSSRHTCPDRF